MKKWFAAVSSMFDKFFKRQSLLIQDVDRGGSTPVQYRIPESAEELQDLIEYREMNFAIGNIFKACYRMGHKETIDDLYDINKILWFAQKEKTCIIKRMKEKGAIL